MGNDREATVIRPIGNVWTLFEQSLKRQCSYRNGIWQWAIVFFICVVLDSFSLTQGETIFTFSNIIGQYLANSALVMVFIRTN